MTKSPSQSIAYLAFDRLVKRFRYHHVTVFYDLVAKAETLHDI